MEPLAPKVACGRWPEHLRLVNTRTGELVRGRCRATNLCLYCRTLYVVETVEMLVLDALEHAPSVWVVLTAREHLTRAECRDHLNALRRSARKRWPDVEWFVQVEFQRRGALHLNLLVKGVPASESEAFLAVLTERWCDRVDALPVGQWCEQVEDATATALYLSKMLAHGLKAEQQPPIGWRGHRTSQTRGYLMRPASVMREEARASLRTKRLLHRARTAAGEDASADLVEQLLEQLEAAAREATWKLATVNPGETAGMRGPGSGFDSPRNVDALERQLETAAALGRSTAPVSRTVDGGYRGPSAWPADHVGTWNGCTCSRCSS